MLIESLESKINGKYDESLLKFYKDNKNVIHAKLAKVLSQDQQETNGLDDDEE